MTCDRAEHRRNPLWRFAMVMAFSMAALVALLLVGAYFEFGAVGWQRTSALLTGALVAALVRA